MTRPAESVPIEPGRYRRISTRMWGDERFRQLSRPKPNAQSLWLYLLTGPQVGIIPGLYSIGERALCEQLGWPLAGFRKVWHELERLEMVRADWTARVIWIPKSVRHNPPAAPNVVKSWRVATADIPECKLKLSAVEQLSAYCAKLGPAFIEAFREPDRKASPMPSGTCSGKASAMPSRKPSGNQEQDQEQDQEHDAGARFTPAHARVRDSDEVLLDGFERFWLRYPNQEQRGPAWDLWLEMAPSEAVTGEIIAAVEAFRSSSRQWTDAIAKRQLNYIPLAKTFLGKRLWCDPPRVISRVAPTRCPHTPCCASDVDCTQRDLEEQLHARPAVVPFDQAVSR